MAVGISQCVDGAADERPARQISSLIRVQHNEEDRPNGPRLGKSAGSRHLVLTAMPQAMWPGGMVLIAELNHAHAGVISVDPAPLVWTIQGFAPPPRRPTYRPVSSRSINCFTVGTNPFE